MREIEFVNDHINTAANCTPRAGGIADKFTARSGQMSSKMDGSSPWRRHQRTRKKTLTWIGQSSSF